MMRSHIRVPLTVALFAPAVAFAAPATFQQLANMLTVLMSSASIVLVVLGLVIYFWGISTNFLGLQGGKADAGEKIKAYFFWGVIILFVMVSVWGILQILQNTLFGGDAGTSGNNAANQQIQFERPSLAE